MLPRSANSVCSVLTARPSCQCFGFLAPTAFVPVFIASPMLLRFVLLHLPQLSIFLTHSLIYIAHSAPFLSAEPFAPLTNTCSRFMFRLLRYGSPLVTPSPVYHLAPFTAYGAYTCICMRLISPRAATEDERARGEDRPPNFVKYSTSVSMSVSH
ncbi:hypothetical protein L227DRAFT_124371 [Lentinus tigrinus ALCF2SS1-6]|uniref:Uncharacterized protein n=1 Tax=Lentinus tigrinus ALCF2SS1-6 TaxID=1328759 RepID=A0A5C2SS15_9APHY|nr:hypothetical protein L227DRAFT_124371 [Lentinus tigrinus ALCF2SS1-6]